MIPTLPLRAADGFSSDGKRLRLNTGGAGYGFELEATTGSNPANPGQTVDLIYFDGLGQKPFWRWSRTQPGVSDPVPQMELDGESNQLRLFDRILPGTQIYLDPSVPEGRIGDWKILTEGTAKPWLEGQNLKVANLEVSGKLNGSLDITGSLTVRSNLIAYGGY